MKKQTTFLTAILSIIESFRLTNKAFSNFDVTVELRRRVNAGEVEFTDKTTATINGQTTYSILHDDVRTFVNELYCENLLSAFTRTTKAGFYVYTPVGAVAPVQLSPATQALAQTVNSTIAGSSRPPVTSAPIKPSPSSVSLVAGLCGLDTTIKDYVLRRNQTGVSATLKSIQSRLKVKGITVQQIRTIAQRSGLKITDVSVNQPCLATVS